MKDRTDLIPGIKVDRRERGREEFVKCPECELVQKARALCYLDQTHPCSGCGYLITCEEWETIHVRYADAVRCPYCGVEAASGVDYEEMNGKILECDACHKQFDLKVEKTVEYSAWTNCEHNGDTHEWAESKSISSTHSYHYNCTKCDKKREVPKDTFEDLSDKQEELGL